MATADAFDGKPGTFYRAMFRYCLDGILRAGGGVAATGGEHRRYGSLIESYK